VWLLDGLLGEPWQSGPEAAAAESRPGTERVLGLETRRGRLDTTILIQGESPGAIGENRSCFVRPGSLHEGV